MNKIFANTDKLGVLYFENIYVYYDGPCVFLVKNILDHKYIGIVESEECEYDRFLLVPVSTGRLRSFEKNEVSIRDAFIDGETDVLFALYEEGNVLARVENVSIEEVGTMNLPKDNIFLDLDGSMTDDQLVATAKIANRGICQISFEKNGMHKQSIKAKELSSLTGSLHKVSKAIVKDWERNTVGNNPISRNELKVESDLNIVSSYAASFGLQFEAENLCTFGKPSEFDYLATSIYELMNIQKDLLEDSVYLKKNYYSIEAIREYFKVLLSLDFEMKYAFATPVGQTKRIALSNEVMSAKYEFLSKVQENIEEYLEMEGRLTAINVKAKTFVFEASNELIKGKIDETFDEFIFDTKNTSIARLRCVSLTTTTNKIDKEYYLLEIQPKE